MINNLNTLIIGTKIFTFLCEHSYEVIRKERCSDHFNKYKIIFAKFNLEINYKLVYASWILSNVSTERNLSRQEENCCKNNESAIKVLS
jgi:hypothetical protein